MVGLGIRGVAIGVAGEPTRTGFPVNIFREKRKSRPALRGLAEVAFGLPGQAAIAGVVADLPPHHDAPGPLAPGTGGPGGIIPPGRSRAAPWSPEASPELTPGPRMGQERRRGARVAELVDARDLKSLVLRDVPVRVRPRAPNISMGCWFGQEPIFYFLDFLLQFCSTRSRKVEQKV